MSERKEIYEYKVQDKVVSLGGGNFVVITAQTMNEIAENSRRMGEMILQLGTMMGTMQRRLDDLEERQAKITISHGDVRRIQGLIRCRADEICRKYNLQDKDSPKIFRAAIKKDVLKRYQVKDLHDIPETAIHAVDNLICSWVNIRMAMERRASI